MFWKHPMAVKGTWDGEWNADKSSFVGTFTTEDGRKFVGSADWVTHRMRTHITPTGHVAEVVKIPMRGVWEYTGDFIRKSGRGATAPFEPEAPEMRDDGSLPPEDQE